MVNMRLSDETVSQFRQEARKHNLSFTAYLEIYARAILNAPMDWSVDRLKADIDARIEKEKRKL